MKYSISETAALSGVSVRTLHYYDKIGLLPPGMVSKTGYRYYDEPALKSLQQILFYKELGFPLKEISEMMTASGFNQEEAFKKQRELLVLKKERLERLITLLDAHQKGENTMSFKEFDMGRIEEAKQAYAAEAKEKWSGTAAYRQSMDKTKNYSKEDWAGAMEKSDEIMKKFAAAAGTDPASPQVQGYVKEWQSCLTEFYYDCTPEILAGLGEMYTADERFRKNINKFGEGTAELMSQAIRLYCAG